MSFEKEVTFLRKKEAEPGEVDLLLVVLDLSEVGVVGEIGRQTPSQPILDVETHVDIEVVLIRLVRREVGTQSRRYVRLELEVERS